MRENDSVFDEMRAALEGNPGAGIDNRLLARGILALHAFLRGLEERVEEIEADYDIYRDALDIVQRQQAAQARPMSSPQDPDDEAKH